MTRSRALLVLLYGLSGAVGLAWQVLAVRAFVPVFGAGAYAIAAVTASFLGGLGLGGALAPRLLKRVAPLRLYGAMELGVGLWGAALPWLLGASAPLLLAVLTAAGDGALATLTRVLLAAVLVGPMAAMLGVTFPAVAAAVNGDDNPDRVGLLYGVNAIGASGGALIAGLWLPWSLGLSLGSAALGAGNLLVAAFAFLLAPGSAPKAAEQATPPSEGPPTSLWITAAVTGAVGMGLELCWSRLSGPLLAARSGSDAVAFAIVLAAVVLGIGIGGVLARRIPNGMGRPLGWSQAVLAVLTWLTLEPARELLLGAGRYPITEALLPLLPAVWLGASFPLLSNALAESGQKASTSLGRLYAINTAGAVVGSLATGFVLMPWLGAQRLAVLLGMASACVALSAFVRARAQVPAAAFTALALALGGTLLVVAPPVAGARVLPPDDVVLDSVEGLQGSTLVSVRGDERALTSSGHRIGAANLNGPVNDHALRALGPTALHPNPKRVLAIGLGTGATAQAFLSVDSVEELVVVELDPNMRTLLHHFGTEGILKDPRLRIVDGDGRWFVRTNTEQWDVISVDAYGPKTASATFYTAEFYAQARARLSPGGAVFVKFNPAAITQAEPLASFLASLWSAFPNGGLIFLEKGLFGLVGVAETSQLPSRRVVATRQTSTALTNGVRLHTDDRPVQVVDTAQGGFSLLDPYWTALHPRTPPPWAGRGAPPPRRFTP